MNEITWIENMAAYHAACQFIRKVKTGGPNMKKTISLLLVASMLFSLTACGGSSSGKEDQVQTAAVSESTEETALESFAATADLENETATSDNGESDIEDEGWDQLEGLGKVQTENGILTVTITVPSDIVGEDVSQEELDENAGETYKSATVNEDGSVTYKMTKKQHRAMVDSIVEAIDEGLQKLVDDDETYSFTEITHNKDFTSFDLIIDADEVGFNETFAVYVFYIYGGMYGIFTGHTPEKIIANYYNTNGDLLETFDSSEMEGEE